MAQATVIGSPISPYVRKVLTVCAAKGVEVETDPIVPFFGSDEFTRLSPLRRIPVFIDGAVTLSDSSVICQYLEDAQPSPTLYPADIAERARARWLEEYADTRLGDVFIWKLFNDAVIGPAVFGSARDADRRAKALETEVPDLLGYLEGQLAGDFFCGALSIADLSVAPFFGNLAWARAEPDWSRWPRLRAWLDRALEESALGRLNALAASLLRAPPPEHRGLLEAAGVPVTAKTLATATPRRGPMTV
jgi:glutathione S-transferase